MAVIRISNERKVVFILRAKHGASYAPPAASHYFSDVRVVGKEWMEPWIDLFYREGVSTGYGMGR